MKQYKGKSNKFISESAIIICGIVRNCGKNLKRNIRIIDKICDLAQDYRVVVFENDSTDNTKQILTDWADNRKNIHVSLNVFNTVTIPEKQNAVNPFFSIHRIEKMAAYRNFYLDYIEKEQLPGDYVIIIDMDVRKICLEGIIASFALNYEWDALTSNGISRAPSSFFRKRYYDSYALIECGQENIPQTESTIKAAQYRWAFLKPNMPLIRVASAFGGLAIYRREAIAGCRYGVLMNRDEKVESRTEHLFLHQQMKEQGYDKIFINPAMRITYQTQVMNTIRRLLKRYS
ncbi:MAG: glycosyltransferase [Dysgonamonadaceae bacterium]|nr:glycosyltransferase [Dysgonamonadaceae bacterium]